MFIQSEVSSNRFKLTKSANPYGLMDGLALITEKLCLSKSLAGNDHRVATLSKFTSIKRIIIV